LETDINKIVKDIETSTGKPIEQSLISTLEGETIAQRKIQMLIPKAP